MSGMLISRRWQTVLWIGSMAIVLILAACGSSSTLTPQAIGDTKDSGTDAMMVEKTPGTDAMMGKTPGTEATTMEKTPGTDATMMEKTPGTDATMMEKTPGTDATMMEKTPGTDATMTEKTPGTDAMMVEKTPGTEATMMEKTPGTDAMMVEKTPGTDATMMEKTPGTDATMMEKTPGTDAIMMEKKTTWADRMMKELPGQIFAPHFVNSSPAHGEKFQQAPEVIVINFNFNLQEKSSISVTRDGAAIATGKPTIDSSQLAIRAALGRTTGDGLYVVSYKACWPDASCHDGSFAFQVDSKTASAYQDMTASLNWPSPSET